MVCSVLQIIFLINTPWTEGKKTHLSVKQKLEMIEKLEFR
jgi:hypothetical protein